jgi:hypothetical protein
MAFDFPTNPVEGQRFDPPDGMNYIWRAPSWEIFATAAGGIPEAPTDGQTYGRKGQTSEWITITKGAVGLGNVDNTSDLNKPVSNATQAALDTKEPNITAGTSQHYWSGLKSWQSISSLPVSAPMQTALDAKAPLASPALTGIPTVPTANPGTNTIQIASTAFVTTAVTTAQRHPTDATPTMNGVAAAGTSTLYARGDHVHPGDTSRVRISGETMTGHLALPTGPSAQHAVRKDYVDAADTTLQTNITNGVNGANANANNRILRSGDTMTGKLTSVTTATGMATSGAFYGAFEAQSSGGGGAFLSFHRIGAYAAYFGIDTDNVWKVGGWSMGNAAYTVWHAGNFNAGATWNTSNFNPASYMPVSGGHFTGNVSGAGYFHAAGLCYAGAGVSYMSSNALSLNSATCHFGAGGSGYILQFSPSWYFDWNAGNGTLVWRLASGKTCAWDVNGYFTLAGMNGLQPGGGPWYDSSDARIKTVKGAYDKGLENVLMLEPVRYVFKGNDTPEPPKFVEEIKSEAKLAEDAEPAVPYENSPHYHVAVEDKEFIGFVAQQLEAAWPEMVTQRESYIDGVKVTDLRDLNTGPLIYALVNAVKTLHARLVALEGG